MVTTTSLTCPTNVARLLRSSSCSCGGRERKNRRRCWSPNGPWQVGKQPSNRSNRSRQCPWQHNNGFTLYTIFWSRGPVRPITCRRNSWWWCPKANSQLSLGSWHCQSNWFGSLHFVVHTIWCVRLHNADPLRTETTIPTAGEIHLPLPPRMTIYAQFTAKTTQLIM